jgi:hypothetical protein
MARPETVGTVVGKLMERLETLEQTSVPHSNGAPPTYTATTVPQNASFGTDHEGFGT